MTSLQPIFPIAVPLAAAVLLLVRPQARAWQNALSLFAAVVTLASSIALLLAVESNGVITMSVGDWRPPFGIVLAADLLNSVMAVVSGVVSLAALVYAARDITDTHRRGNFHSLFHFMIFGINGAFLTGDLFNLFVFFEIVLMSSYVLLVLGNKEHQARSTFVYFAINLTGSCFFLAAAGILYGLLGTLNMAQIAQRIPDAAHPGLITAVGVMFLCVFGLKGAMFPLFTWLPGAYTSPPTPVAAVFAGLLTKVGVYALYRAFGTMFVFDVGFTHHAVLAPLAALTMIVGVLGAVVQTDVRFILAFHSISQVGYILMGLALYSPLAVAAGLFHMIHHSLVKSSLFLIGGGMGYVGGTQNLKKLGGLMTVSPSVAILFLLSAMALAGIPPLSGFFSKMGLVVSGLDGGHGWLVAAALLTSVFTLFSMIKIWRLGFWGERKEGESSGRMPAAVAGACGLSVVMVLALGLFAGPVMKICRKAADQLLDRTAYVSSVLENSPGKPRSTE